MDGCTKIGVTRSVSFEVPCSPTMRAFNSRAAIIRPHRRTMAANHSLDDEEANPCFVPTRFCAALSLGFDSITLKQLPMALLELFVSFSLSSWHRSFTICVSSFEDRWNATVYGLRQLAFSAKCQILVLSCQTSRWQAQFLDELTHALLGGHGTVSLLSSEGQRPVMLDMLSPWLGASALNSARPTRSWLK